MGVRAGKIRADYTELPGLVSSRAARCLMSALPVGGKLLTTEQTMRLAVLDSMGRERVIEAYVAQLRTREGGRIAMSVGRKGKIHPRRGLRNRAPPSIYEQIRHPMAKSVPVQ